MISIRLDLKIDTRPPTTDFLTLQSHGIPSPMLRVALLPSLLPEDWKTALAEEMKVAGPSKLASYNDCVANDVEIEFTSGDVAWGMDENKALIPFLEIWPVL